MAKQKKTPFAVKLDEKTGRDVLYLDTKASGIEFLVACIDGMQFITFSDNKKRTYFLAQDVVNWHRKELEFQPKRKHSREIIEAVEKAISKVAAGETQENAKEIP